MELHVNPMLCSKTNFFRSELHAVKMGHGVTLTESIIAWHYGY